MIKNIFLRFISRHFSLSIMFFRASNFRAFLLSSHWSSILVPRLLPDPIELDAGLCADLDAGGLGGHDSLLDGQHQVLRVQHQHLRGLSVLAGVWNNYSLERCLFTCLSIYTKRYLQCSLLFLLEQVLSKVVDILNNCEIVLILLK